MTDAPIRFGILGTARIARRIVADMQSTPLIEVVGIASRDASRARWYADQYGIAQAFDGYQSMLDHPDIDAIYIPLPPSLHGIWAMAAADAGKHVLVEKPCTQSSEMTQQMADRFAACKLLWLDATAWLHHQRTARIKTLLETGAIGQVQHISSAVSFFEPFQSDDHRRDADLGGGCLLDLGWYAYGIAHWVAQRPPARIDSIIRMENQVPFRCTSILDFGDSLSATVNCGYDTATRKWIEIAGDEASIVCDDFTRPNLQRPTRFWLHDRASNVTTETFEGNQELQMLVTFAQAVAQHKHDQGGPAIERIAQLNAQAMSTQSLLEQVVDAGALGANA